MRKVQPLKLDLCEIHRIRKVSLGVTEKESVMINYLTNYYDVNRAELFRQMLKAVYYQTYKDDKYMT